jgi:hypothetical protein
MFKFGIKKEEPVKNDPLDNLDVPPHIKALGNYILNNGEVLTVVDYGKEVITYKSESDPMFGIAFQGPYEIKDDLSSKILCELFKDNSNTRFFWLSNKIDEAVYLRECVLRRRDEKLKDFIQQLTGDDDNG